MACLCTFLLLANIYAFFSMLHMCRASQLIQVPQDYPTIRQAIDAAIAGDTVRVNRRSGETQSVYYERLTVNKQLLLVGESRETIVIDGSGGGSVIRIQADYVQIRNLTIRNAGQYNGIRANSHSYVTIANNTIETSKKGIALLYSHYNTVVKNQLFNNNAEGISLFDSIGNNVSDNEVLESAYGMKLSFVNTTFLIENTITDNSYGIYLEHSSNDTLKGNTLRRNSVDGIFFYKCHDITISNNEVTESAYSIQLHTSHTMTAVGNNATGNSYGIYLAYSYPSNIVENNTISINDWGIVLYNSSSNTIRGNTLSYNTYGLDPEAESNNNVIYHNNFIDNTEQAVWNPDYTNTWDDGYPSGGNYWSDYTGTDADEDGIGDTAYSIDPMNKDRYPLMAVWGGIHDVAIVDVTPSTTSVPQGEIVYINVTATNEGTWKETFDVTAKYNSTIIGVQTVNNLPPNENTTLTFNWNTTDVDPGDYTIRAEATTVVFETDTADNAYTDGTVSVLTIHDVAIAGITATPTTLPPGIPVLINVTVQNHGHFTEDFNVTVYADRTIGPEHYEIGNETVSLNSGTSTVLDFTWNATEVRPGEYQITAKAILPEDWDPEDNIAYTRIFIYGGGGGGMGLVVVLLFPGP